MSQENVEVLRKSYEALNRRDLDAAFEAVEPEFELQLPEGGMNVGSLHGRDAVTKLFQGLLRGLRVHSDGAGGVLRGR